MDSSEKKPKKRGRKPKNTLVNKSKGSKEIVEKPENLIIKLNKTVIETDDITGYVEKSNNFSSIENESCRNVSEVCWNCCHHFDNNIHGIPLKYSNKVFYIYGDFCSLECGARYAFDNLKNLDFPEIYSNINLYNNIIHKKEEKIEIAPNKLVLKMFGGDKTIDEYRSSFKNKNVYDVKIPPILPINHIVDRYETNQNVSKSNLKLYRSKPLPSEKKSICSSMKLIIDN